MKCVLHIGTAKTGTTLLQNWLYANQEALGRQGVYLSDSLGKTNNRRFSAYFQNALDDWTRKKGISSVDEKREYFDGFLHDLGQEIDWASASHEVMIITSEQLHSRVKGRKNIARVMEFLKCHFDEISVVCYFRKQSAMGVSLYSTGLKNETKISLSDFLDSVKPENYYYNLLTIARNWSAVFGRENCVFRFFDRRHFLEGDLRKDFLSTLPISINTNELSFEDVEANTSLSRLQGACFRAVNDRIPFWDEMSGRPSKLNRKLKRSILQLGSLRRAKISPPSETIERIDAAFEVDNAILEDEFFDGKIVFGHSSVPKVQNDVFSIEQVETIIEELLDCILPEIKASSALSDHIAARLRDIALKIEKRTSPSLADALVLMKLAQQVRPDGPLINEKVQQYADALEAQTDSGRNSPHQRK